jgi:hypothetical protein
MRGIKSELFKAVHVFAPIAPLFNQAGSSVAIKVGLIGISIQR